MLTMVSPTLPVVTGFDMNRAFRRYMIPFLRHKTPVYDFRLFNTARNYYTQHKVFRGFRNPRAHQKPRQLILHNVGVFNNFCSEKVGVCYVLQQKLRSSLQDKESIVDLIKELFFPQFCPNMGSKLSRE